MSTTYDLPGLWAATLSHRYGACSIGVFSTLEKAQEACQARDEEVTGEDAASLPMIWQPGDPLLYEAGAVTAKGWQEGDEYIIELARLDDPVGPVRATGAMTRRCLTCLTDQWDFLVNNQAQCKNGHRWIVPEAEL